MADFSLDQIRAWLNSDEAKQLYGRTVAPVQTAIQNMPGVGIPQAASNIAYNTGVDILGKAKGVAQSIFDPAFLEGRGPEVGAKISEEFNRQYAQPQPASQQGRDILGGVTSALEASKLPPYMGHIAPIKFGPDQFRVLGKTAIEDVRNFGNDFANARQGIQREYPTTGSRAATGFKAVEPTLERAYNQYMEEGIPAVGVPPGGMYAVKPKGGNWPTNLGSTLPLKEQGKLGEHLSKAQYDDPVAVFQHQLEKYHPRAIDNRKLVHDFEDFRTRYLGLSLDPNSPDRYLSNEELSKKIADEFATTYNQKLEEGQKPLHTASQIEQTLPHYNSWVMGPFQKYITNQMGTGVNTDPLLQIVNESGMPPHEIFGQPAPKDWETGSTSGRADRTRNSFLDTIFGYADSPEKTNAPFGKITATTPEGIAYENALDSSLYPKGPYAFKDKNRALTGDNTEFPAIAKLDSKALISDFLTSPDDATGFTEIRKQVFKDLLSGKLDPSKLSNVTPATVTRQMIKDKMAEFKEAQLSKQGAADWIPKRAAAMPTDTAFPDGSKMTVITPEMANADEPMTARDLGQITIDLNQCVGAGCHATQDYSGHGPYLVPHTGKPPRGKIEYDKYNYLRRLKSGEIEIASLKDPQGVSQATVNLKLPSLSDYQKDRIANQWIKDNVPVYRDQYNDDITNFGEAVAIKNAMQLYPELNKVIYGGRKSITEMKGKNNSDVEEEYIPHMVEWLNKNADTLDDVRDLSHLKGVHDLNNHYNSIGNLVDQRPHWYSPTVEEFFQKADDEKLLPRFFTIEQFGDLATQYGVDLSAEPKNDVVNDGVLTDKEKEKRQKYYETVSQELRNTFQDEYLQDAFNGDQNALQAIIREVEERPTGYFLGTPPPGIQQHVINRLRNQGLYTPNQELDPMQAPNFEPEPNGYPRPTEFQRGVLRDAMDDYFNNREGNTPEDMAEPHANSMRILLGNQNPEARLSTTMHQGLVETLLDQDVHTADIRNLIASLQRGNVFLSEAQIENALSILTNWTERYPLRER